MKKILSILLSLAILATTCVVPALASEGTATTVDIMSSSVANKSHFNVSTQAELYQKNLTGVTIGNLRTDKGVTNVWVAFDLKDSYDVASIDLYQTKKNIQGYRVYATNEDSVYSGLAKNNSISADTLSTWDTAGYLVAEGNLNGDNSAASTLEEELDTITFTNGSVNARYIILVVTSVKSIYTGVSVDYVGINNKIADSDDDNTGDENEDVLNDVTDITTTLLTIKTSYNNSSNARVKTKDLETNGASGAYTRAMASGSHQYNNMYIAFDLESAQDVASLDIYQQMRNIKSYEVYATNDSSIWQATESGYGLTKKGEVSLKSKVDGAFPTATESDTNAANVKLTVDGVLDKLAGSMVASGTLNTPGASTAMTTYDEARDTITFANGSVNARYIYFVITEVHSTYSGCPIDYIGINSAKSGIENIAVENWAKDAKVTYTANLVNTSTQNARPVVIFEAQKTGQGALLNVTMVERTLDAGKGVTFNEDITLVDGAESVEFFILDKGTLAPFTKKFYSNK